MRRKPKIFLSHASEDQRRVLALFKKLEAAGYRPWTFQKKLIGGDKWRDRIKRAIRDSDAFIFCMSKASVSKRGVLVQELNLAKEIASEMFSSDIFIIPLKFDDCEVPEELKDLQFVNYYSKDGFQKLEEAIKNSYRVKKNSRVSPVVPNANRGSLSAGNNLIQEQSVSKYFVGRAEALKEFYNLFSYRRQKNIIYYEAEGGLGKSWLLRKIYEDNNLNPDQRIVFKPINFADLKNRSVKGLRDIIISNLGKKYFAQFHRSEKDQFKAERARKEASILAAKREKTDFDFFEDLNDVSAHREIVFLFDTFEIVQNTEVGRWFIDDLLARAENLIIVFAGRPTNPPLELPFKAIRVGLAPFNYDEAEEFFQRQAVRFRYNSDLISRKEIEKLCDQPGVDGLPLRLELALNHLATPGSSGLESIIADNLLRKDVEEKLIHFVRSELVPINPVLRDMAILKRRYDREIINTLMKSERLYEFKSYKQIANRLGDNFIVKTNPDGSYALHDQIQRLVEEHVLPKPKFGINDILGRQLFDTIVETWYTNKINSLKKDDELRDLLTAEQLGYRLDRSVDGGGIQSYEKYFKTVKSLNSFSFNELILNELLEHRDLFEDKAYSYLREQAEWLYSRNHFVQAANIFKKLVQEYQEPELYFNNLAYWGSCLLLQGKYLDALVILHPGHARAMEKADKNGLATFENYFAFIYQALGRWSEAKIAYTKALEYSRIAKNVVLECRILIQFGEFQALLGEYQEALGYCDAALNTIRNKDLGNQIKGEAYLALAKVKRYQGNAPEAETYYEEALRIFRANKSGQEWICNTLQSLGANQFLSSYMVRKIPTGKRLNEAIEYLIKAYDSLNESLRLCREFSLSPYLPECLYRLGRVMAEIPELSDEIEAFEAEASEATSGLKDGKKALNVLRNKILRDIELPEEALWRTRRRLVFSTPLKDLKQEKNLLGLAQRFCEVGYLEADAKDRIHASLESLIEATRFALARNKNEDVRRYAEKVEFSRGIDYQEELFIALVNIIIGDLLFEEKNFDAALNKYKEYFPRLVQQKGYGFYRFDRHYDNLSKRINRLPRGIAADWCKELLESWLAKGLRETYPGIIIRLEGLKNSLTV